MRIKKNILAEIPADNTQTVLLYKLELFITGDKPHSTELAAGIAGRPFLLVLTGPAEMEWRSDPITPLSAEEVQELPRRGIGKFQQAVMQVTLAAFGMGKIVGEAVATGQDVVETVRMRVKQSEMAAQEVVG